MKSMFFVRLSQYWRCVILKVLVLVLGLSSCALSLTYEFMPTSLMCRSRGSIFIIISREACGVVLSMAVAVVRGLDSLLIYFFHQ